MPSGRMDKQIVEYLDLTTQTTRWVIQEYRTCDCPDCSQRHWFDVSTHAWYRSLEEARRYHPWIRRVLHRSGRLIRTYWTGEEGNTHTVYIAEPVLGTEDTILKSAGTPVSAKAIRWTAIPAGHSYWFDWGNFHETPVEELTLTLLRKTKQVPQYRPRVLVPIGQEPDNQFSRYAPDPEALWDTVRRAWEKVEAAA